MKKTTKGLLSALLLTAMCGTVGCKPVASSTVTPSTGTTSSSVISSTPETVADVNLVSRLADGGQGVYTVTNENGKASVAYTKNSDDHKWAYVVANIDAADKMEKMNTLKFALSGVGTVIIKLEGASGNVEVKMLLSDVSSPYELNLLNSKDKIGDATKVIIFAAPDSANATGTFVVDELTLTANDPDNYIVNPGWSNIDPNSNVYDGVADTFSFNKNWIDNDQVIHKFTYNDDGTVKVDYNKGAYSWAFAYAEIAGKYGAFPYITFKVQGTAGEAVLFKVEPKENGGKGNREKKIDFDGTVQTVTLDLSEYTAEERASISRVLMFGAPGVVSTEEKEATGSYTIHAAYFTHNYEGEKPVVYTVNEYNGTDQSFGCNANWHDNGDKCYTVEGEGPVVVNYTDNKAEWSTLRTLVNGKLGNFSRIDFGVKVAAGKQIMVKAGGKEAWITGTGEYDGTCSLDLSELSVADRNNIKEVLIFAEPGVAGVAGSFEIHWMAFNGFKAQENEYNGTDKFFNINQNMQSPAHFTTADANGATKITWAETLTGEEWSTVKSPVKGDFTNLKALSYNVTVPAGRKVLLKLDGTGATNPEVEHWLDNSAGAEAKAFNGIYDFSHLTLDQIKAMTNVLIFPLGGEQANGAAGEVVVSELRLTRSFAKLNEGALDFGSEFFYGAEKYSYAVNEGAMTVNYTETKGEWDNIYTRIINDGYTTVTIEVTGTADKQVLFKFENEANGGNAKEQWHTCDGTKQTVTVDITTVQEAKSFMFLMFAEGSKTGVSGSYTIHSVTFSK